MIKTQKIRSDMHTSTPSLANMKANLSPTQARKGPRTKKSMKTAVLPPRPSVTPATAPASGLPVNQRFKALAIPKPPNALGSATTNDTRMSSMEIASRTGKEHADVMLEIRTTLAELGEDASKFAGVYDDACGSEQPCYLLPPRESYLVTTGYSVPRCRPVIQRSQALKDAPTSKPSQKYRNENSRRPLNVTIETPQGSNNDSPTDNEDLEEIELPQWVEDLADKSTVKYDVNGEFFHATKDDYKCGKSNDRNSAKEPHSRRTDYDLGPYGTLPALIIDGCAWCSLKDAGSIAGVSCHQITGFLYPEEQTHVRGVPGHLKPDGIRWLGHQGIPDNGIRLEALVKHVEESRSDDPRVAAMLQCALVNIYDKNHDSPASLEIPCIDLWRPYARPMAVGQIPQHVHYDSWEGEYLVVWIGTQLWFRVEDISYCTHFSPAVVMQMAGKERTLKLPDSKVYPLFDTGGEKAYVRADAVERLIAAMPQRPYATDQFVIRIIKAYRAPQRRWMYDESVKASTLHRMLGAHLDFKVWSSEMLHKHHKLICADNSVCSWGDDEDFKISLHLALDMAAKEGTFAGDITALLLTDSGYLHGGPIDETPDASLERFVGLVPDRHGRVQIRKLWELSNTEESFEDWYQGTPMLNHVCEDAPNEHLTTWTWELLPDGWSAGV